MMTVTFTLTGREKTFTDTSFDKCCKSFFDDYGEVIEEVKKIHLFHTDNQDEEMIVRGKKSCATMLSGLQMAILQPKEKI
tara:strand:- start:747 stop:986 length:240 start_codon:yes stop_codon:yes gene_type:complete